MIIISARKDFDNPDQISTSGHSVKEIDLNNDSTISDKVDLNNLLTGKKTLFLVHGYNNEQFEVYDAYQIIESQIGSHLAQEYDYVIGYSWPGGDRGIEWWQGKSRANSVARMFRRLLEQISSVCSSIDIMSHSLGARVTLKALKESQQSNLIRNYFCTAPAVDNESLEPNEEFYNSLSSCKNIYVCHSARDGVLSLSYRAAEWDRALGLNGPEDKAFVLNSNFGVFVANCKKVVDSHGGYKRCDELYQYISGTLAQNPSRFVTL